MGFGNIFVQVLFTYYTMYFLSFLSSKKRNNIQERNITLKNMRTKKIKTLDEQKAFINLKYPKKGKISFVWKSVPRIILMMILFMFIFFCYRTIFYILHIDFKLWHALIIIILLPIIINILLSTFSLQKDDIRIFFR